MGHQIALLCQFYHLARLLHPVGNGLMGDDMLTLLQGIDGNLGMGMIRVIILMASMSFSLASSSR
jgi:hypothetical protein